MCPEQSWSLGGMKFVIGRLQGQKLEDTECEKDVQDARARCSKILPSVQI